MEKIEMVQKVIRPPGRRETRLLVAASKNVGGRNSHRFAEIRTQVTRMKENAMADPQALSWREAYRMIAQETDKEKLGPLVMAAEAAMFRRFQELESSSDHYVEHAELKAATDELLVLKVNTLGWPAVR